MYTQEQLENVKKVLEKYIPTPNDRPKCLKEVMESFGLDCEDANPTDSRVMEFLTKEELSNILCDGFDSVSPLSPSYDEDKYREMVKNETYYSDKLAKILVEGGSITILDYEDTDDEESPTPHELKISAFKKALEVLRDEYPQHWADLCNETEDFYTYDAIIQIACFGDIVYG